MFSVVVDLKQLKEQQMKEFAIRVGVFNGFESNPYTIRRFIERVL